MVQKNVSVISSEEFSKIKPPSPKAANQQVPPPPPPQQVPLLSLSPTDDANLSRSLPADVSQHGGQRRGCDRTLRHSDFRRLFGSLLFPGISLKSWRFRIHNIFLYFF